MSERLFEDTLTFDLKTLGTPNQTKREATSVAEVEIKNESTNLPDKGDWSAWGNLLKDRLSSKGDLTEYDVESKFFKEFFSVNWGADLGIKLDMIGTPLKKAIRILGFDPKINPILGFIVKRFVIGLVNEDKLNADTFKAIYNAVAKKLVSNSEFIRPIRGDSEYNIIYCAALYNKTSSEIEKYLELQSKILNTYSEDEQTKNKKVFLKTSQVSELDLEKRAEIIKKKPIEELADIISVTGATLNSIKLAELINDKEKVAKVHLDNAEQDKIVGQVKNDPAKVFAALLSLSTSTGNKDAGKALSDNAFSNLTAQQVASATLWLTVNNVLAKGQLQDSDAASLVNKLMASIAERLR